MDKAVVVRLHSSFEDMVRKHPETGTEFWCARDLQMLLGYTEWRNFAKVVDKAITACHNAGYDPRDHFVEINKMVSLGSGAERQVTDIGLTRYACYLIAQNGDPSTEALCRRRCHRPRTSGRSSADSHPNRKSCLDRSSARMAPRRMRTDGVSVRRQPGIPARRTSHCGQLAVSFPNCERQSIWSSAASIFNS